MHQSIPKTIDYVEMPSTDLAATRKFFTTLFGWTFADYGPEYCAFDDGRMAGGFFASSKTSSIEEGAPLIIFHQQNLEEAEAEVKKSGGMITKPIFSFPGGRRFHFEAPGGGEFAIWAE